MAGTEKGKSRQTQRQRQRQRERTRRQRWRRIIRGGGIALLGTAIVAAFAVFSNHPARSVANVAIDGIACQAGMDINYHIHTHLTLYDQGRPVVVPQYVGIPFSTSIDTPDQYCFYWLHTHATSGVIHVESPTPRLYTLGQFFDIWSHTAQVDAQGGLDVHLDDSFVRDLKVAKPRSIHVYNGGTLLGSDYPDVTLTDHKVITVEIGTPLKPPTTSFDWAHWNGL
jgi:hypothetical protein